jgi:hypothetical protein
MALRPLATRLLQVRLSFPLPWELSVPAKLEPPLPPRQVLVLIHWLLALVSQLLPVAVEPQLGLELARQRLVVVVGLVEA